MEVAVYIDSIYGPDKAEMKLSVYESGIFHERHRSNGRICAATEIFTDQNSDFDNVKNQIASMTILMQPKTINFSLTQQSMLLLQPIQ
jgi:hypothetical protein